MDDGIVLALDGHDGTGKTTLAQRLAQHLGADYVRPFQGAEGAAMLATAEAGQAEEAARIARRLADRALAGSSARIKVLDRHWMTVLTLLPESLWKGWLPPPPTVLLAADLETTLSRLRQRPEKKATRQWHAQYIRQYEALAARFEVPILRTDRATEGDAFAWLLRWASSLQPGRP